MPSFATSIEIAASPETVWKVLVDVERWPEWTGSITRITRLNQGPLRVGGSVRIEQPKLAPAVWTISEWREPVSFTWINRQVGVRAIAVHAITPCASGARVELSVAFVGPLVGWLFGRLTQTYLEQEARGLKERSERVK